MGKQIRRKKKRACATHTIEETAEILGLGRNATYQAVKNGDIPVIKVGGRFLVPKEALKRKLAEA